MVETNGVRLHCAVTGRGPLMLLLHGFPECWYSWRHQIAALAPHFRVVAPDLRGYNESEKPEGVAPYALAEARFREFLELCGRELPGRVESGEFGARMEVALVNDGPVTLWLEQ